jgi:hypothetical protein
VVAPLTFACDGAPQLLIGGVLFAIAAPNVGPGHMMILVAGLVLLVLHVVARGRERKQLLAVLKHNEALAMSATAERDDLTHVCLLPRGPWRTAPPPSERTLAVAGAGSRGAASGQRARRAAVHAPAGRGGGAGLADAALACTRRDARTEWAGGGILQVKQLQETLASLNTELGQARGVRAVAPRPAGRLR